jgi:hypothetical protein
VLPLDLEEGELRDRLDNLLRLLNAKKNDETRADLILAWCRAANAKSPILAPKSDLGNMISKVIERLSDLHRSEDISIQLHQIGAGIVDISPLPNLYQIEAGITKMRDVADPGASWQATASDLVERLNARDNNDRELLKAAAAEIERLRTGIAIISMLELLKAWLERVKKMPCRKRGQPPKEWARQIVWEAAAFAFRHSVQAPSNDSENPFQKFVPEFYECVTGVAAKTGLTGLIKEVLAEFHKEPGLIDDAKLRFADLAKLLEVNRPKSTV